MTLFVKTMLDVQPINDLTLDQIELNCLYDLGSKLFETETIRKEHESDFSGLVKSLNSLFGEVRSINSNCISYEYPINFNDSKFENKVDAISRAYMISELGRLVPSRFEEYLKFIFKIFKNCKVDKMEIKIFKIGNVEYYCYSL